MSSGRSRVMMFPALRIGGGSVRRQVGAIYPQSDKVSRFAQFRTGTNCIEAHHRQRARSGVGG